MGKNKKKRKRPAPDRRPVKKAVPTKYALPKRAPTLKEKEKAEKRRQKRNKVLYCILGAILAAAILAGIIFGIAAIVISRPINYFRDNLSRYVYISEEDYKNVLVMNKVHDIPEINLEQKILELITKHKGEPVGEGTAHRYPVLSAGDEVELRYIGYLIDGDGTRRLFDGGCNFYGDVMSYEIGSGGLVTGFELGLLGKNVRDYATMDIHREGSVEEGDTIRFSATVIYPNGKTDLQVSRFAELGAVGNEKLYGEGFDEFFVGKTIGEKLTEEKDGKEIPISFTAEGEEGTLVYTDITVDIACRMSEGERLTVKAYFPHNYGSEELDGKVAYFDVFVMRGVEYTAPEYNDGFITDKLKLTAEDLEAYDGESLAEKHRNMLKAQVAEEYENSVREVVENYLWEYYLERAEIKKLPSREVDSFYNSYIEDIQKQYESQGMSYGYSSLDSYARAIYELDENADWREHVRGEAEDAVKMKLIFHYICNEEDIYLDEDEMSARGKAIEEEYLTDYLKQVGCTRDKFDSEEKYLEAVEKHRRNMLAYYEEDFFEYEAFYGYAMEKITKYVTFV